MKEWVFSLAKQGGPYMAVGAGHQFTRLLGRRIDVAGWSTLSWM
jgi:hypothetical protein